MNHPHLADSIQKLKDIHPESPAWIMDRAEAIADQRMKLDIKERILKTSSLMVAYGRAAVFGMGAILAAVDKQDLRKARKKFTGENSVALSFDWAFENMRRATCEFIINNDVPLHHFSNDETAYLFPNGIPTRDNGLSAAP